MKIIDECPCEECPVLAVCISKDVLQCDAAYTYYYLSSDAYGRKQRRDKFHSIFKKIRGITTEDNGSGVVFSDSDYAPHIKGDDIGKAFVEMHIQSQDWESDNEE